MSMLLSSIIRKDARGRNGARGFDASRRPIISIVLRWDAEPRATDLQLVVDADSETAADSESETACGPWGYEISELQGRLDDIALTAADVVRDAPGLTPRMRGLWLPEPLETRPRALRLIAGRRGRGFTDILVLGEAEDGAPAARAAWERHHDDGRIASRAGRYVVEGYRALA
jgi:hypothetical protein